MPLTNASNDEVHEVVAIRLAADSDLSVAELLEVPEDEADAHLAALAIEHGLQLATTDDGFGRFTGLTWFNPLRG